MDQADSRDREGECDGIARQHGRRGGGGGGLGRERRIEGGRGADCTVMYTTSGMTKAK